MHSKTNRKINVYLFLRYIKFNEELEKERKKFLDLKGIYSFLLTRVNEWICHCGYLCVMMCENYINAIRVVVTLQDENIHKIISCPGLEW